VPRLRACYLTVKKDSRLIEQTTEEIVEPQCPEAPAAGSLNDLLDEYQLFPCALKTKYLEDKTNEKTALAMFSHLSNHAAREHWSETDKPLLPSSHLHCWISADQRSFLNPTLRDVLLSTIEKDGYGERARKKRARRRQDMIDGNAKSYARWLNSPARMESYAEFNAMQAAIACVRDDADRRREEKSREQERKKAEKKAIADEKRRKEEERIAELMPELKEDTMKGVDHVNTLRRPRMEDILQRVYGVSRASVKKLTKLELKAQLLLKIAD
jgi:hypothetical protein